VINGNGKNRKKEIPPWLKASASNGETNFPMCGKLWLHNEILAFIDHIDAKPAERAAREGLIKDVSLVIKSLYSDSETVAFGSAANNLCIPGSDVDLVVFNTPKGAIHRISRWFRSQRMVEYMEVIAKARIPIIKLRLNKSPYTVDISFDQKGGPETGKLIRSILKSTPTIRPLLLLLKYFLSERDLNETYRGGVGSHCCLMMVISMLQHTRRKLLSKQQQGEIEGDITQYEDLGTLLLEYLDIYGLRFNYANVCIKMTSGGRYTKKPSKFRDPGRPGLLCLENPEDSDLDIGKGSYNIVRVRKAFAHAHRVLLSNIARYENTYDDGNAANAGSILSSIISVPAN